MSQDAHNQDLVRFDEERPSHYYRTEIPNCVLDSGLDPYEIAVYCHIKRMAGDNNSCFQSQKKMAEHCKISERKLRMCLESLCKINPILGISLIRKKQRKKEDGSLDTCIFVIVNVWNINGEIFCKKPNVKDISGTACGAGGVRHVVPEGTACGADKEERFKNNERIKRSHARKSPENSDPPTREVVEIVQKIEDVGKRMRQKFVNREVPCFLKLKSLNEKDQKLLANQFTDSELNMAIEDARSYHKKKKIVNAAAFITQRCQYYRSKRMETASD